MFYRRRVETYLYASEPDQSKPGLSPKVIVQHTWIDKILIIVLIGILISVGIILGFNLM